MSVSDPIRVVVVAIGGYARSYVQALLEAPPERGVQFVAAVDPYADRSSHVNAVREANVPIFDDLETFYAGAQADLAVIASPIHRHVAQACVALEHGSGVLLEKPLAATIQDARRLIAAAAAAGRPVAVGYQRSFSSAVGALKRDIIAGKLGRPKRLKSMVCWPRPASYYARSHWAGRLKTDAGQWVLDSPVNNATAHFLHNMFYLLGPTPTQSATPVEVQAELYRAKPIESLDTGCIRARVDSGAELLFWTSHATREGRGPVWHYEFEQATVHHDAASGDDLIVEFHDGSRVNYGNPEADHFNKLWQTVEAVRSGAHVDCPIEAGLAQTLCVNGAHESMPEITPLPPDAIRVDPNDGDPLTWMAGLADVLRACFDRGCLPSELGDVPWARPGRLVDLRDYTAFPAQ